MKNSTLAQKKSFFRIMAIIMVCTVTVAIFPSCKGKAKPSDANSEQFVSTPPPPLPYNITDGDTVWFRVDELPVFPGGEEALSTFLGKNIAYPEAARKKKIQGRVVVGFILTKECKITSAKIVTGIDPDCDNEAIRVVNSIPRFEKPAQVDGRPVSYHFTLPVHYTLQ